MRGSSAAVGLLLIPACSCFTPGAHHLVRRAGAPGNPLVSIVDPRAAFAPPRAAVSLRGRNTGSVRQTKGSKDDTSDLINTVLSNTAEGELGTRGELYVGLQFSLILLVTFGPAFQDWIESTSLLSGLALSAGGLTMGFLGVQDLGNSLAPWPKPVSDGTLQRDGVYGIPLYGSLIVTCVGLSVLSLSFPRLLFTGMLYALLNAKAAREEEFLVEAYPDYSEYSEQVKDRLIPYASAASSLLRTLSGGK